MQILRISLANFKNISEVSLSFSPKINCFLGNNGMGKSNLLDAIYYLSFCRSFSGVTDPMLIRRGEDFCTVKAEYLTRNEREELILGIQRGRRKTFKRGGKEYKRLSEHIGRFPLVMAAPQDMSLITGPGEERRRWMDMVISQSDPRYLDALIRYGSGIEQRNRLLRAGIVDRMLFQAIETAMEAPAQYICRTRAGWIEQLTTTFDRYYHAIAGPDSEHVSLSYRGALPSSAEGTTLAALLDEARRHDEIVKYTTVGPHRDDIEMLIEDMPMRRSGSQGQCKTFTTALRLAQYDFLRHSTGVRPLLLLDDVFDKLDAGRVQRIMEMVTGDEFGQIFVTDTNRKHLDDIVSHTSGDHRLWSVDHGNFQPSI